MNSREQFLMELDRELPAGRRLVERLPEAEFEWRPHSSARTLSDVAWHMSCLPGVVGSFVVNERQDMSQIVWPKAHGGVKDYLAQFDESTAIARSMLENQSDADLEKLFSMVGGDTEFFTMPRGQFIRWGLITHFIHHRAQLERLKHDWPDRAYSKINGTQCR